MYFNEFEFHILNDEKPSLYFNELLKSGSFPESYPFNMLSKLASVPQSGKYHPEGSVWNHTMLVIDEAAKRRSLSKNARAFMWAALLHDLGKAPTTKVRNGKITSYDHDKIGQELCIKFLSELTDDADLIKETSLLVRWHMQILFVLKDMPFADIDKMSEDVSIDEIALLSLCDRLGRGEMTSEKLKKEEEDVRIFIKKCQKRFNNERS